MDDSAFSDASARDPASTSGSVDVQDQMIGRVLNERFQVQAMIGDGGYGCVYRGVQLGINRKVAIKLLRPDLVTDPEVAARFRREGLVMCNLKSAHTISTFDVAQTHDGTMYIVMELLEGRTLKQVFDEEAPLAWPRIFRLIEQICIALTEAHESGIVHRDLKPANIHVETQPGNPEFVKVLDFGIAKIVHGAPLGMKQIPQLTVKGQTVGTLRYMSPEQLMGHALDGTSDIYSLGVMAYELMTGRVPFARAKSAAELTAAHMRDRPKPPSQQIPSSKIPPSVDAVVLKMLERDQVQRYQSAEALRLTARKLLDSPEAAKAITGSERDRHSRVTSTDDETIVISAKGSGNRPWLALAFGVALVALAGVIVFIALS